MKVLRFRQEAHHRGYRIEGEKRGGGWILRVRPPLVPVVDLPCWRFYTLRGSWAKAVVDVARYIDAAIAAKDNNTATTHHFDVETARKLLVDIQARCERLATVQEQATPNPEHVGRIPSTRKLGTE